MVTIESIEGVTTLVVIVKIVKTPVETMEQVVALEQSGDVDNGYVNQVDHGMSWPQRNENYYATQDTDHGYRPSIWEQ